MLNRFFKIDTAENALIFFKDGSHALIIKRFDIINDGSKLSQEDFASLAGRTPQTHGEQYKYLGNYLELFQLMKTYIPAYIIEAPKLFKILLFNYLFSNGDAHYKNFSLLETTMGDYKLSPAYDLLNSRIHVEDNDFALEEGLLPAKLGQGNIRNQFTVLAQHAGISEKISKNIIDNMQSQSDLVEKMVNASFLNERTKRNYLQSYQRRLKRFKRIK